MTLKLSNPGQGNLRAHLKERLDFASLGKLDGPPPNGDHALNPNWLAEGADGLRDAAVLIPIIDRAEPSVLLTQRPTHLAKHAGQVAFPGGRVEPEDRTPIETALRETEEEVGLARAHADIIGTLSPYRTGTGFRILPVVAVIEPVFSLKIDAQEVEEAFEVPFDFLMDPGNHQRHSAEWGGRLRHYYAMPYGRFNIWGATAGIIVELYQRLTRK